MRKLRYSLELPDGTSQDQPAIAFAEAEELLRRPDWRHRRKNPEDESGPSDTVDCPFLLFLDGGESFFMILPETEGYQVTTRVLDKWNLLGISASKSFTLEFGVLKPEDTLALLKLFFEDNYPALRALERELRGNYRGRDAG